MRLTMEWISVEERAPKATDNPVLGYDTNSNMPLMAWYHPISREWECFSGLPVNITHWMPLPPPPGEDQKREDPYEKEYDKIMKINYYLLKKYKGEIFSEFGIPDGADVETMRKIIDVFDMMYEEVQKEMPGMWYEYGFVKKE